jgi:hypothetical protein
VSMPLKSRDCPFLLELPLRCWGVGSLWATWEVLHTPLMLPCIHCTQAGVHENPHPGL